MTDAKTHTTIIADDYDRLAELVELTKTTMPELSFYLKQELDRRSGFATMQPPRSAISNWSIPATPTWAAGGFPF
jgi:hypothetical protein